MIALRKPVKVNLITGFLGTGKTTSVLHCIKALPDERVAVVVNEFGQTGIDGAVLETSGAVAVKEVAGGCLCCVTFLPLQLAINDLISRIKPDRILIEPSGLGHPARVLELLLNDYEPGTLDVRATIALADPGHFTQAKYRQHETYADQIALAEVLVFNKTDLYPEPTVEACIAEAQKMYPPKDVVAATQMGRLLPEWLNLNPYVAYKSARKTVVKTPVSHMHAKTEVETHQNKLPLPNEPIVSSGHSAGMYESGVIFHPDEVFDRNELRKLFADTTGPERAKGIFRTAFGFLIFQRSASGDFTETPTTRLRDSRAEAIDGDEKKVGDFIRKTANWPVKVEL